MPNHLHAVVGIENNTGLRPLLPTSRPNNAPSHSLGTMVAGFKAASTSRINPLRGNPTNTPVWQVSYYDTVIRNERHLQAVREYIQNNPRNWQMDAENLHPELWSTEDDALL